MYQQVAKAFGGQRCVAPSPTQFVALITEGIRRQTLVVVSELIIFACFGLVLRYRGRLAAWAGRLPGPPWARFLLLAWTSGMVAATAYLMEPIHPNLLVDWLLTTPWYLMWFGLWWWVLGRFAYSVTDQNASRRKALLC